MRKFEFSGKAKSDLTEIYGHIFEQDALTASLIVGRIEETVNSLCVFPKIGKRTTKLGVWVFSGSRKFPFRIAYRFDEDRVTILRIFRVSRENVRL